MGRYGFPTRHVIFTIFPSFLLNSLMYPGFLVVGEDLDLFNKIICELILNKQKMAHIDYYEVQFSAIYLSNSP